MTVELGQALFGNPVGEYDMPEYATALLHTLLHQMEIEFWKREQKNWERYEDPQIPGIVYRPYCWCNCGDEHTPECPARLSNFEYDGVEIRWYKYPGRGMTCNKELTPNEWS